MVCNGGRLSQNAVIRKMKKEEISIPITFEVLLKQLYGRVNYHGSSGHYNITRLKKIYVKIIASIKRAITLNLSEIDSIYKNNLIEHCSNTISKIKICKDIDRINITIIDFYTRLSFQLLGDLPDNWDCHRTAHSSNWKLDKHRNILYISSDKQKSFIILDSYRNYANELKPFSEEDLWNKLNYELSNNYTKFIDWFKLEYPLVYVKLF